MLICFYVRLIVTDVFKLDLAASSEDGSDQGIAMAIFGVFLAAHDCKSEL